MADDLHPFNPNRGDTSKGNALVPLPPAAVRNVMLSAENYLSVMASNVSDAFDAIGKAAGSPPVPQAYSYARFSYMPDGNSAGLMAWPGMNPDSLRKVARENSGPRMVINQRKADVARYSGVARQPWQPGWRIEMVEVGENPSNAVRRDIRDAERFLENCSRDFSYVDARERDAAGFAPFSSFLAKTIEDIYTYDGWATWTDTDNLGRVKAFASLPGGNIRLAFPGQGYRNDPALYAALVDETGNPISAFTRDEMTWKVLNPRTDPDVSAYGWSFIEQSIRLVTAYQGAVDLNADTFQRNGIPNGLLLLMGDFWNQDQLDLLQREWQNMKKGQSKVWTVPVLAVPEKGDVKIVPLNDLKGTDVRYRDHMNMMLGAYCAVVGFPASRLGLFASGHNVDNQPVKGEATQLAGVDDVGLPRDLNFIAETVTQYLLAPNWPHLRMKFMQADPKAEAREYEQRKLSKTWGETRAETDMKSLESLVPEELKPLARLMSLMPEDPGKTSAFATLASQFLGGGEEGNNGGGDDAKSGAPFPAKTDPAESKKHGHASGVRRNSRAERGKQT